jgi:hypothetical protein
VFSFDDEFFCCTEYYLDVKYLASSLSRFFSLSVSCFCMDVVLAISTGKVDLKG